MAERGKTAGTYFCVGGVGWGEDQLAQQSAKLKGPFVAVPKKIRAFQSRKFVQSSRSFLMADMFKKLTFDYLLHTEICGGAADRCARVAIGAARHQSAPAPLAAGGQPSEPVGAHRDKARRSDQQRKTYRAVPAGPSQMSGEISALRCTQRSDFS